MARQLKVLKKAPKIAFIKEKLSLGNDGVYNLLKFHYEKQCIDKTKVEFDILPPSANNLYNKSVKFDRFKKKNVVFVANSPEVEKFRNYVFYATSKQRKLFCPHGSVVILVKIHTEKWLNKNLTLKKIDLDNMIKALLDALQESFKFPDELFVSIHKFKYYGKTKTEIEMFQMENFLNTDTEY